MSGGHVNYNPELGSVGLGAGHVTDLIPTNPANPILPIPIPSQAPPPPQWGRFALDVTRGCFVCGHT